MKKIKKESGEKITLPTAGREKLRGLMESTSVFGLILVAAGLLAPFVANNSPAWLVAFKWIFAAGALIYTAARIVGAIGRDGSFRTRRLRRLEVWAGIAFCIAGFFWFWNTARFDGQLLSFRMLNETILFSLAGAMIQIVASWMLSSSMRKDKQTASDNSTSASGDKGKKQ